MAFQTTVSALAIVFALLFVGASLAGAWFSGMTISTGANLSGGWMAWGHDVGGLCVAAVGISSSCLKAILPLHLLRPGASFNFRCLLACVLWLVCLAYCWSAVVLAGMELPSVAGQRLSALLFLAGTWGLVEIAAGLLPAVLWAAAPSQMIALPKPATNRMSRIEPGLPVPHPTDFEDVLSLLLHVSTDRLTGSGLEDIQLQADGTLVTTQSKLAKVLRVSKSSVHRQLTALQDRGEIRVTTTAKHTCVEVLQQHQSRSG